MTVQNDLWRELERIERNAFSLSQEGNIEVYRKALLSLESRAIALDLNLAYRVASLARCFQEYIYELWRPESRNTLEGSPRYQHAWVQGRLETVLICPVPFWKKYPLVNRRVEWVLDPFSGMGRYQFMLGDLSPLPVAPLAPAESCLNSAFSTSSKSSSSSDQTQPKAQVGGDQPTEKRASLLNTCYPSVFQSLEEDDDACVIFDADDPAILRLKTLDPKAEISNSEMLKNFLSKMQGQASAENNPILQSTVPPLLEKECRRLDLEFSFIEDLEHSDSKEELLHTLIKELKLVAEIVYLALNYEIEGIEPSRERAMHLLVKAQKAVRLWGSGTKPAEKEKSLRKSQSKMPEEQAEFFMANMLRDIRVEVEKFEKERDWESCERAILYIRQLQNWREEQGIAVSETLKGVEGFKKRVKAVLKELVQTAEEALTAFIGIEELAEESRNCTGQIERAKKLANTF